MSSGWSDGSVATADDHGFLIVHGHKIVAVVAALGMLVAGFFLVRSLDGDLVYYLTTSEAVADRSDFPDGRAFRLSGVVVAGSVANVDAGTTTFEVSDGGATVPVRLIDTPPPLFDEEVPVLLAGSWSGQEFVADQALIRHDENYSAPSTGNYPGS